MSKTIRNYESLSDLEGDPYQHVEQKCPPGCNGPKRCDGRHAGACCILEDERGRATACQQPQHLTRRTLSVAGWLKTGLIILGRAAQQNMTLDDGVRAADCLRQLNRAERTNFDTIRFYQEGDLDWLRKAFFDDAEAKRLLGSSAQGGTPAEVKGVFAIKVFDPTLAIALKRVLDGESPTRDDEDTEPPE